MPSLHFQLLAGLALAGLAAPVLAQVPDLPGHSPVAVQAPAKADQQTPLQRDAVEDIVRRTLAASCCQDCCQDCCCPAFSCYRWEGAIEFTFLQPRFDQFGNGSVNTNLFIDNDFTFGSLEPQYDLDTGVRYWLGYVGPCGLGGRVRYWSFDAESETVTGSFDFGEGGEGTESLATSLEMHVVDIEGLFRRPCGLWLVQAGVGIRYARLERSGVETQSFEEEFGLTDNFNLAFEGVGPTLALEGRRRIACGLSGIVNTRASLLAGRTVERSEEVFVGGQDPAELFIDTSETDDSLFVLETQIGLEYARPVGAFEFFGRALLEAQYWFDGGKVIGDNEFGLHQNLGLIGCTLAAGFRR